MTKISARVKYPSRSTRLTMTACREYCQLLILALYVCGLDCNFVWWEGGKVAPKQTPGTGLQAGESISFSSLPQASSNRASDH